MHIWIPILLKKQYETCFLNQEIFILLITENYPNGQDSALLMRGYRKITTQTLGNCVIS
jgi:hypothetical protein